MKPYHPMRDLDVVVFHSAEPGKRKPYVAFFDSPELAICFWGPSAEEVRSAALRFRDDAVEANEATYLKRLEALEKGREKRAKRKAKGSEMEGAG